MVKMHKDITQKRLKEVLHYDPYTGIFTWKRRTAKNIHINNIAGFKMKGDYLGIGFNKKQYRAHRLAWLYMEGYWPENDIDHVNRIRNDNRWCNLRIVSKSCNMRNRELQSNNTTGVTGVCWHESYNKYLSTITINSKNISLGHFKGFTKAVYVRWKAEVKYNWPDCNSTSTAYLYLKNKGLIK